MQITERDRVLLEWINRFGYVQVSQIGARWGVSKVTAYGRAKKLIQEGLLEHRRFWYQAPGLYSVSRAGCELAESKLPSIKNISAATIRHQLAVVDLFLQLSKDRSVHFITERELRQESVQQGIGSNGHIPDGVLLQDGQKIALEVELTAKSKKRLTRILNQYRKNFEYQQVWYFCGSGEVFNLLKREAANYSFLEVKPLVAE